MLSFSSMYTTRKYIFYRSCQPNICEMGAFTLKLHEKISSAGLELSFVNSSIFQMHSQRNSCYACPTRERFSFYSSFVGSHLKNVSISCAGYKIDIRSIYRDINGVKSMLSTFCHHIHFVNIIDLNNKMW